MKKLLLALLCMMCVVVSGCGDKFAKEKEAMEKAEKAALAVEVPIVVRPEYSKTSKPTKEDYEKYKADFKKFLEVEDKIVAEARKSDAQIDELLKKAENDSEKKNLNEFKEKLRKARIDFVKKVSKGRLRGDTFIVGVGSTWQEVELVYGTPKGNGKEDKGFREYAYDGIVFDDWIGGGAYPPNHPRLLNWRSTRVQAVRVTGKDVISDAGVRIGMTKDEVHKALKAKYVRKSEYPKGDPFDSRGQKLDTFEVIIGYSMQDTLPMNLFCTFKDGKLTNYSIAPH